MSQEDVPATGTVLAGKYRVEGQRGSGGMAVILEATRLDSGRRVALKVLKGSALRSQEAVARFEREMKVTARLGGEHVARVYDSGATPEGAPFLVMELLEGHDLEGEIALRGRFPPEEAVRLVLEACEGVAEAHRNGLVHRDLKPGNLFLAKRADGSLTVKVLDFGLSKVLAGDAPLTQTTVNIGTPLYMAPEQIASSRNVEVRTDQHALAAILCTLLTGKAPYQGESLTELAVAISVQPPPNLAALVASIPPGLEAVVHKALAKKPTERYADVAEFAEALAPFAGPGGDVAAARVRATLSGLVVEPHPRAATMPLLDHQRISGEFGRASVPMAPPSAPMSGPSFGAPPPPAPPSSPEVARAAAPASPGLGAYALPLGLAFVATVGMLVAAYFVYTSKPSGDPVAAASSDGAASAPPPSATASASVSASASAPPSAEPPPSAAAPPPEPPPSASGAASASASASASAPAPAPKPKPRPRPRPVPGTKPPPVPPKRR